MADYMASFGDAPDPMLAQVILKNFPDALEMRPVSKGEVIGAGLAVLGAVAPELRASRAILPELEGGSGILAAGGVGGAARTLTYQPSSGVLLQAVDGQATTILGSYSKDMQSVIGELGNIKSMDFGAKSGGFNVLNAPDSVYSALGPQGFWNQVNVPFLNSAVARGDNILMATRPAFEVTGPGGGSVMTAISPTTGKISLSGFGREYYNLRLNGYTYQKGAMVLK